MTINATDLGRLDTLFGLARGGRDPAQFWTDYAVAARDILRSDHFWIIKIADEAVSLIGGTGPAPADLQTISMTAQAQAKPVLQRRADRSGYFMAGSINIGDDVSGLYAIASWSAPAANALSNDQTADMAFRFSLALSVPDAYQSDRTLAQSTTDVTRLARILDLIARLYPKKSFAAAALECCNLLAANMNVQQAALGWRSDHSSTVAAGSTPAMKLRAINHQAQIVRGTEVATLMQRAMTEAADNNTIIQVNAQTDLQSLKAHERYFRARPAQSHILTIPLSVDDVAVGALLLEREGQPFDQNEIWQLKLYADHLAWQLTAQQDSLLSWQDRLTGKITRWWHRLHKDHDRPTLIATGIAVALLLLALIAPWPYDVEGTFRLRTDTLRVITAPFDGVVDHVNIHEGQTVQKDDTIATINTRELMLDYASTLAELEKALREAQKARAAGALVEMRVADAEAANYQHQLNKISFRINNANLSAPFDGIIARTDLESQRGAPVKRGDILAEVAAISGLFLEIEVSEDDISRIDQGQSVDVTFLSRPGKTFPATVDRILPVGQEKNGMTVFRVHAALAHDAEQWWRPGMSGAASIDVGWRSGFGQLFGGLIDSLRMAIWL